jgi:hypothetical protein
LFYWKAGVHSQPNRRFALAPGFFIDWDIRTARRLLRRGSGFAAAATAQYVYVFAVVMTIKHPGDEDFVVL